MASKTIIRYLAPVLVGRRELSPRDFESLGIFTQKKPLVFTKETNFWLDAEAAGVSKEALKWFGDSPEFTVETQDLGDEDPESLRHQEAYAASVGAPPPASPQPGSSASETTSTAASGTTTQSTAKKS